MAEYSVVLLAGVLASLHCVGMCGPIVLAYSISGATSGQFGQQSGRSILWLHAAYNVGRILAYSALGVLAGLVGMAFGSIQTIGEYVSVVGGAVMIVAGFLLLGFVPVPSSFTQGWTGKGIAKLQGSLLSSPSAGSKMLLGLLTPLLPCGVLYAMIARAVATHTVGSGALVMALFAVGMTPALVLVGAFSSVFSAKVRRGAEQLAAVTIILMGISLVLRGLHIPYLHWLGLGGHGPSGHNH